MSKQLELRDLSVHYGERAAVDGVSLLLPRGRIGCLLGPSGCGKTSLLRAIAGFEPVSAGEIVLGELAIASPDAALPPEKRRVGMVFQDFALFPHLDVSRNVSFGLGHLKRSQRRLRVTEMLELVGLADRAKAMPHQLSGGQQQRVALARALAPDPDVLLLDEPFSSLDSELREQLAGEVRALLRTAGTTAVLVTHDQQEAFAVADTVALMHEGRVVQAGTPAQLYHRPVNAFVAGFIGDGAVIQARAGADGRLDNELGQLQPGAWQPGPVQLLVRPEAVRHALPGSHKLEVVGRAFRGARQRYRLRLPDGQEIVCYTGGQVELDPGELLSVDIALHELVLLPD